MIAPTALKPIPFNAFPNPDETNQTPPDAESLFLRGMEQGVYNRAWYGTSESKQLDTTTQLLGLTYNNTVALQSQINQLSEQLARLQPPASSSLPTSLPVIPPPQSSVIDYPHA